MSLFLRTFISNSLSREMLNFSTFTESQNQLGWKGLPRNIHSTTGQPKYVLWMYNKLPLLWRTNKSILILYIESCTRITATSFLYSWGAQWMSALTYLSQEVWAYYSAKFPTYFFQLLKRNIPQGMNEGLTTFISVFQNATSSVGEFFLTRSGQCFVTLNIDETITFQLKFLWLTNIYIYVYIKINISNSGCLNTQSKPCMCLVHSSRAFFFTSWLVKSLWCQQWESEKCWLKHK